MQRVYLQRKLKFVLHPHLPAKQAEVSCAQNCTPDVSCTAHFIPYLGSHVADACACGLPVTV